MAKLEKSKINAYAFYSISSALGTAVPMSYITIFMTENLLYSAALMGTTLLIARLIDFAVGLVAGGIVEKTRLKWGKFRSWIVILRFVVYVGCVLLFIDTSAFSTVPKMIITIVGYCSIHCSMNFLQTAQFGILSSMAGSDMEDRNALAVRSAQGMALAMIITSATTLPFIQFITPYVGNTNAYLVAAAFFGLFFVVGGTILVKAAEPYDPPQPKGASSGMPSPTVKDMIKSVFSNSQLLVYISANSIFFTGMMLFSGIMAYYFMYVLGNYLLMSVAMTTSTVFGLAASVIGPKIGMKLGKKKAMVIGLLIYTLGSFCISLFAKSSVVIYIVITCINSVGMYIFSGFGPNYIIDTGEYGFYKTGKDNRAVAMGTMTMPMKIGMMVGGALAGYGLEFIGYSAGMAPTPEFVSSFMWLLGGLPAAFYLIAAIIMAVGYKITDADAAKYAAANAEKMAKMMEEMQQKA